MPVTTFEERNPSARLLTVVGAVMFAVGLVLIIVIAVIEPVAVGSVSMFCVMGLLLCVIMPTKAVITIDSDNQTVSTAVYRLWYCLCPCVCCGTQTRPLSHVTAARIDFSWMKGSQTSKAVIGCTGEGGDMSWFAHAIGGAQERADLVNALNAHIAKLRGIPPPPLVPAQSPVFLMSAGPMAMPVGAPMNAMMNAPLMQQQYMPLHPGMVVPQPQPFMQQPGVQQQSGITGAPPPPSMQQQPVMTFGGAPVQYIVAAPQYYQAQQMQAPPPSSAMAPAVASAGANAPPPFGAAPPVSVVVVTPGTDDAVTKL